MPITTQDRSTAISWTKQTWNPVTGCSKVSAGCDHCYAERLALQYGWTRLPWTGENAAQNVVLKPHKLKEPYKLKEPTRIFVNSMSDCFHPQVPDSYLEQMFAVMCDLPQHTFQILTKRPRRAARWAGPWPAHIWMGTSVESTEVAWRVDVLRECQTRVRFLSIEPLISPLPRLDLTGIHWVIVGGESGPGYRPMPHAWAREIRDQCIEQGVAFFFKQSAAPRTELGTALKHVDGTFWTWQQYPDQLTPPAPALAHRWAGE